MLTESQLAQFGEDGYYLAPSLFDAEETALLQKASRMDPNISGKAVDRDDGSGGKSRITLWNDADDGILSLFSRCERIAGTAEQILGDEVYHWHSKMMQKEPFVGDGVKDRAKPGTLAPAPGHPTIKPVGQRGQKERPDRRPPLPLHRCAGFHPLPVIHAKQHEDRNQKDPRNRDLVCQRHFVGRQTPRRKNQPTPPPARISRAGLMRLANRMPVTARPTPQVMALK